MMIVVLAGPSLVEAARTEERPPIGLFEVVIEIVLCGIVWTVVGVTTPTRSGWGVRLTSPIRQVWTGVLAAAVAFLPTTLVGLFAQGLGQEQDVVRLLRETKSTELWVLLGFSAVVLAPLLEEMLFRVLIQGWLTTRIRPDLAIATTATIFSAVHGWPAMVGLMPFAVIIGYAYHQTGSLLTVLAMHMTFNASSLLALALQVAFD